MRKCLFLLVLLCGTLINLNGQDTSLVCQPFVPVVLDVSGNNCQGEVSPFDLLIGDLSDFSEGDFQINIFDDNPVNGGILDGVGPFLYEINCLGANVPICENNGVCTGQVIGILPDLEITSDASVICPAGNSGNGIPGGTQSCEKVCAGSTVTYFVALDGFFFIEAVEVSGSDNFTIFSD
ncbi:MAG: hypothetical protein KI786_09965, partial [Mameliella sp.]|nr:hypothetical protein [Phaeodactylibacter sp.]